MTRKTLYIRPLHPGGGQRGDDMNNMDKLSTTLLAVLCIWISGAVASAAGNVDPVFSTTGSYPTGVAFDGSYVWIADDGTDRIYKVNPSTGSIVSQFPAPGRSPEGLAWDGTYLWVCDWGTDKIYKVNPTTGDIVYQIPAPYGYCRDIAWDGAYLWVVDSVTDIVCKLNPITGAVVKSFASPCPKPRGLAWDGSYLWVSDDDTGYIIRLSTNGVAYGWMRGKGNRPYGLAWQPPKYLWVADYGLDQLYRLNTHSGRVVSSCIPPSSDPRGMTRQGNYIWYIDRAAKKAYKITTAGQTVTWFYTPGNYPEGIAFDGTYLWISDSQSDKIYKCDTNGNKLCEFNTVAAEPKGLAWDGTWLYNVDKATQRIYKINPSTGDHISWISTPGGDIPEMLDYDQARGSLWLSEQETATIYLINPSTRSVEYSFRSPLDTPLGVCVDGDYLWLGGYDWNYFYKVNLDVAPPNPKPTANFSASPRSGPEPLTVHFTDQSVSHDGIVSWFWTFGDGSTSTQVGSGGGLTHTYAQEGSYTVTLTVKEADNDMDTETKTGYITVTDTGPTANFSASPRSGPPPLTVNFTDESTSYDGIVSWSWNFGDGTYSTERNPSHTYTQEGSYTVMLVVNEGDNDSSSKTKTGYITVEKVRPTANFSATPRTGSEPLTVGFTDLSVSQDGIVSWLWSFGDGSSSMEKNPTHTYLHDGSYTVTLTVEEADGDGDTKTETGYITVRDTEPTANFSASPTSGYEPLTVTFTDQSTSYDGIVSWFWTFGDGSTSTEKNPSHAYSDPGTYTVTLTVSEADNDSDTETKTGYITVTPNPKPIAKFSASPTSGPEPLTVVFTDHSTSYDGIVSWFWTFGDGSTSTEKNPSHTYLDDGAYTVTLTVKEADNDSDTRTKTDHIIVRDTRPIVNFSATPRSGTEPLTVNFTDHSTSYDGIVSWFWTFGDGSTSTEKNPSHTYTQDGTYMVCLSVEEHDGSRGIKSETGYISVTDTGPTANFSASPRSGPEPLTVHFTDQSTSYDGVIAWQWDFGDGFTSQEFEPTHVYLSKGTYDVSLIVWEYDSSDSITKKGYITVPEGVWLFLLVLPIGIAKRSPK